MHNVCRVPGQYLPVSIWVLSQFSKLSFGYRNVYQQFYQTTPDLWSMTIIRVSGVPDIHKLLSSPCARSSPIIYANSKSFQTRTFSLIFRSDVKAAAVIATELSTLSMHWIKFQSLNQTAKLNKTGYFPVSTIGCTISWYPVDSIHLPLGKEDSQVRISPRIRACELIRLSEISLGDSKEINLEPFGCLKLIKKEKQTQHFHLSDL